MQIRTRILNFRWNPEGEALVERRLQYALGRFGGRIDRVEVVFEDVNGPRAGTDKRCLIHARLKGGGDAIIEEIDQTPEQALTRAADRIGRVVSRDFARRRDVRRRSSHQTPSKN